MQDHQLNNELFTRLAKDDEHAFREIFHFYTPRLHPFILRIVKSEAVAEEMVQEVFMKLWINRSAMATKENPSAWLFTVAANQSLTFLRRLSVERRFINAVKNDFSADTNSPIEETVISRESERLLQDAVNNLPARQKLVYSLSRNEGLSHEKISDQLGISPNTVKNHIISATRNIRQFLQKTGTLFFSILF